MTDTVTATITPTPAPTRPEGIPEKFWDAEKGAVRVEDLAKSYTELETRLAAPKTPETPAAPTPEELAAKAAEEAAKNPTGQFAALREKATAELTEGGTLSDETYAGLEAMGFSRADVDVYVAGQQAIASNYTAKVYEEAGGEAGYAEVIKWAATGLTPEEIEAYDNAVQGNDPEAGFKAVKDLVAKYRTANGIEGKLVVADPGAGKGDLFEDKAALTAAMRDPKYAKDASFRAEVQAKLQRSLAAGKKLGI